MAWDKPQMELLQRLWLSAEAARTISEHLGRGVTRTAVIGQAHRPGLTGRQGIKGTAQKRSLAPKARYKQARRKVNSRSHSR